MIWWLIAGAGWLLWGWLLVVGWLMIEHYKESEGTMATALIALADGFEDLEATAAIDVLRRGGVGVTVASVHDRIEVRSAHGVVQLADVTLAEAQGGEYDAIVLPGGNIGTENLRHSDELVQMLQRHRAAGHLIAAICAAPTLLSEIGILAADHHATCYPSMRHLMSAQWVDQPVVEHDGIVTGQAPGAAVLFALVVLKALAGDNVVQEVARGMVCDF